MKFLMLFYLSWMRVSTERWEKAVKNGKINTIGSDVKIGYYK